MIKYLVISDVHLGHSRNTTVEIIRNLDIFFGEYQSQSQFVDLDIIFIAGDLFDTLLDLHNDDIHHIQLWLHRLMCFCVRHNIALRILEGTPSHDWKQSTTAETIAEMIGPELDFKYIDTLFIENNQKFGLSILYVPDEWTPNADVTFNQVKELVRENGLITVDIAIMHGGFRYQLMQAPEKVQKHNEADYLSIVSRYISIGHIHSFSINDRIIAQGSFDRLAHGEEEPKGGVLCVLDDDNGDSFYFIENKFAKTFITIDIKRNDIDSAMSKIDKTLSKVKEFSYVRIKAKKDHPIYVGFDQLKAKYPLYTFSKTSVEDEEESQYSLISAKPFDDTEYVPISITKDNIKELLLDQVRGKYELTQSQQCLMEQILTN